jgi:Cullin family
VTYTRQGETDVVFGNARLLAYFVVFFVFFCMLEARWCAPSAIGRRVCRYLNDKDMFERFYKQHLSKRLLAGRVTNDGVEAVMLQARLLQLVIYHVIARVRRGSAEAVMLQARLVADICTCMAAVLASTSVDSL